MFLYLVTQFIVGFGIGYIAHETSMKPADTFALAVFSSMVISFAFFA